METPKVTRLLNPFAASLPVALDPGNLSTFHLGTTDGGWQVSEQGFALETNHGVIRQADCRLLHVAATPGKTVAVYRWQDFTISLHVEQADADAFFRTWLGIVCSHGSYELLGVTLLDALVAPVPYEVLEYRTFVNAPTVAFLRGGSAGVFLGIENPFFVCHHEGNRLCLSYAPAMTVSEGDTHTTEALFIGSTARTGKSVAETSPGTNWTPRFHNPSGEVPLDWGEIEAMRAYVSRYMRGRSAFSAVFYRFWHPHEPWLQTAQDAQKLCRELDTFAQMGGDAVIFLPFGPLSLPDGRPGACWKLAESPLG